MQKSMIEETLAGQSFLYLNFKGLGPFQTTRRSKLLLVLFLTFEFLTGFSVVLGTFLNANDIYAALANVTAVATLNQAITKALVLALHRKDFLDGMSFLKKFWASDRYGAKAKEAMDNYQFFVRKVLLIFKVVIVATASLYLSKPFLEGKRMLPMLCFTVCNIQDNSCYSFYYIMLILSLTSQCITLVGFDGLFFILLVCGYGELEQLEYGLDRLNINEDSPVDESRNILEQMNTLIEHHNLVLDYISKIDSVFRTVLLSQFAITLMSLCSGLFILTVKGFPPSLGDFMRSGPYIISVICQILIYCAVGEKIAEKTANIAIMAYETNWYTNYQPKFRKAILLLMQRAQKRSQITAGGVWKLDMETFVSIVKGSMSMLAFMQTVYSNKN